MRASFSAPLIILLLILAVLAPSAQAYKSPPPVSPQTVGPVLDAHARGKAATPNLNPNHASAVLAHTSTANLFLGYALLGSGVACSSTRYFNLTNNVTTYTFNEIGCSQNSIETRIAFYHIGAIPSTIKWVYFWYAAISSPVIDVTSWENAATSITPTLVSDGYSASCTSSSSFTTSFSALNATSIVYAIGVLVACTSTTSINDITGTGATPHYLSGTSECYGFADCVAADYIGSGGTALGFTMLTNPQTKHLISGIKFTGMSTPVPNTHAATGIGFTSAYIHGNLTTFGDCALTSPVPLFGFYYGPTGAVTTNNLTAGSAATSFEFNSSVTGLSEGTSYDFQAWTTCKIQGSVQIFEGSILSFITLLRPTVTTEAADGINGNDAVLHATYTTGDCQVGTYAPGFSWGNAGTALRRNDTASFGMGGFNVGLSGLSPGILYGFRAWFSCFIPTIGTYNVSDSNLTFRTTYTAPTLRTLNATQLTTVSATLNGFLDSIGSFSSLQIGFLIANDSGFTVGVINVSIGSLTSLHQFVYFLKGLSANQTYYVKAWAFAPAAGLIFYGNATNFTTNLDPLGAEAVAFSAFWILLFLGILAVIVVGAYLLRRDYL